MVVARQVAPVRQGIRSDAGGRRGDGIRRRDDEAQGGGEGQGALVARLRAERVADPLARRLGPPAFDEPRGELELQLADDVGLRALSLERGERLVHARHRGVQVTPADGVQTRLALDETRAALREEGVVGALPEDRGQALERRLARRGITVAKGAGQSQEVFLHLGIAAVLPEIGQDLERARRLGQLRLVERGGLLRHLGADRRMGRALTEGHGGVGEGADLALLAGEPLDGGVDGARLRVLLERLQVRLQRCLLGARAFQPAGAAVRQRAAAVRAHRPIDEALVRASRRVHVGQLQRELLHGEQEPARPGRVLETLHRGRQAEARVVDLLDRRLHRAHEDGAHPGRLQLSTGLAQQLHRPTRAPEAHERARRLEQRSLVLHLGGPRFAQEALRAVEVSAEARVRGGELEQRAHPLDALGGFELEGQHGEQALDLSRLAVERLQAREGRLVARGGRQHAQVRPRLGRSIVRLGLPLRERAEQLEAREIDLGGDPSLERVSHQRVVSRRLREAAGQLAQHVAVRAEGVGGADGEAGRRGRVPLSEPLDRAGDGGGEGWGDVLGRQRAFDGALERGVALGAREGGQPHRPGLGVVGRDLRPHVERLAHHLTLAGVPRHPGPGLEDGRRVTEVRAHHAERRARLLHHLEVARHEERGLRAAGIGGERGLGARDGLLHGARDLELQGEGGQGARALGRGERHLGFARERLSEQLAVPQAARGAAEPDRALAVPWQLLQHAPAGVGRLAQIAPHHVQRGEPSQRPEPLGPVRRGLGARREGARLAVFVTLETQETLQRVRHVGRLGLHVEDVAEQPDRAASARRIVAQVQREPPLGVHAQLSDRHSQLVLELLHPALVRLERGLEPFELSRRRGSAGIDRLESTPGPGRARRGPEGLLGDRGQLLEHHGLRGGAGPAPAEQRALERVREQTLVALRPGLLADRLEVPRVLGVELERAGPQLRLPHAVPGQLEARLGGPRQPRRPGLFARRGRHLLEEDGPLEGRSRRDQIGVEGFVEHLEVRLGVERPRQEGGRQRRAV